jgi:preprotein translocase subunit SecF
MSGRTSGNGADRGNGSRGTPADTGADLDTDAEAGAATEADGGAELAASTADDTAAEAAESPAAAPSGRRSRGARPGAPVARQVKKSSVWSRLYHGETNVDFVGRRKVWFTISLIAVCISVLSLATRGLNLGIDFEGGAVWEAPAGDASVADVRSAVEPLGLGDATIQELSSDDGPRIRVESDALDETTSDRVTKAIADVTGSTSSAVDRDEVGPSWGKEISRKAIRALIVFLILVTIYIAFRFELKMAIPTLVALVHDVIITVGVYSLTGLEVTPATVIAVLTILGYSIYDGIVVFDKVDENTRLVSSTGGLSYGGMVDVSLNQALMRSLNTTMTALLPVMSLLVVGSWMLGATVLEEFALALLIGLFAGAYSSIFIASPLLAVLKEREPRYRDLRKRIDARGGDAEIVAATIAHRPGASMAGRPAGKGTATAGTGAAATKPGATVAASGRTIPPRPRKKTKGRR